MTHHGDDRQSEQPRGLYGKYIVTKANGKPIPPEAFFIVLRQDDGQYVDACRAGALAFADGVASVNPQLAADICDMLLGMGYNDLRVTNAARVARAMAGGPPDIEESLIADAARAVEAIDADELERDGRRLTVPEKHQLNIARRTMKLSDVGARILGGMNKAEARAVIAKLTGKANKGKGR